MIQYIMPRFATEKLIHYQPGIKTTMNPNEVSMHICNAPFCTNSIAKKSYVYCWPHRAEREKYNVKRMEFVLPLWAVVSSMQHSNRTF